MSTKPGAGHIDNLAGSKLAPNATQDEIKHFLETRDDVFIEMIYEMGRNLGFSFDKRELAKYSYSPQGWATMETEQGAIRALALELLQGKRPIPVAPFQPPPSASKFPPPPNRE